MKTIKLIRIYWTTQTIIEPPCSGWSHALVLSDGGAMKMVLCPFSLKAFNLHANSPELLTSKPTTSPMKPAQIAGIMRRRAALAVREDALPADWTVVAEAFDGLGEARPDMPVDWLGEGRGGGKAKADEAEVLAMRPVKARSKRGRFLKWFLDGGGCRSIAEAMTEFTWTRNNVLTHLHGLRKDHGVGYALANGMATVDVPGDTAGLFC